MIRERKKILCCMFVRQRQQMLVWRPLNKTA